MTAEQVLTIGRIVHYRISKTDVESIVTDRMMANQHRANMVRAGDVYPAIVVRVHPNGTANLKVQLDGPDVFWATSRAESKDDDPAVRCWYWPPRVPPNREATS